MNKFIGIGRWTKDLELTITNSGKEIVKGTIAIQDKFKKDHSDFLNVVMFGKTGVLAEQYTKKGSLVAIEGKVQTGKYQNKEGNTVYTFDIVADSVQFLDTKQKSDGQGVNTQQTQTQDNNPFKGSVEIENSDLPF